MSSVYELQWQQRKAEVLEDMTELISLGVSLETARRLTGWNPTLDFDDWADITTNQSLVPVVSVNGLRQYLTLAFSRSDIRVNSGSLEGAVLDAGKLYAIFVPDIPELLIADITFELDGSTVHTEFSTPWDYAGTAGGGEANRVTFVAGSYTIEAIVNATGGPYSFDAAFTVE